MLIRAGRVFTGEEEFSPGVIEVLGDRITGVGPGAAVMDPDHELPDALVVPGFVDVHSHGGGGASFSSDVDPGLAMHLAHGTTTMVASLVTEPLDVLAAQVAVLRRRYEAGDIAGIHLEGPWLSEEYKGAHAPELLRDPAPAEVAALIEAGGGAIRMVTIAPERPGGMESVRLLAAAGVVAALGHTAADLAVARQSIAAGVTGATHLFNAMPPLKHRAPGPLLALLEDPRVWLELIMDTVHVDPGLVRYVAEQHPDRLVFVTDAMAAAGSVDGEYILGDLEVTVVNGVARLKHGGSIAGSTLTLNVAVQNAVAAGLDWRIAVRAATLNPARYLGLEGVGELVPGARADLVVLDSEFGVRQVMHRGAWV